MMVCVRGRFTRLSDKSLEPFVAKPNSALFANGIASEYAVIVVLNFLYARPRACPAPPAVAPAPVWGLAALLAGLRQACSALGTGMFGFGNIGERRHLTVLPMVVEW